MARVDAIWQRLLEMAEIRRIRADHRQLAGGVTDAITHLPLSTSASPSRIHLSHRQHLLEEEDMIRVNSANGFLRAFVEPEQSDMLLIGRLVERVVPRYPSVVLVMLRPRRRHLLNDQGDKMLTRARCSQMTMVRSWKSLWS